MKARMKQGCAPAVIGCRVVPPFPEYWDVPPKETAGVAALVRAGIVEYEPTQRGIAAGTERVRRRG